MLMLIKFPMMLVLSLACMHLLHMAITLCNFHPFTHLPSICPFTRSHVLISALCMHLIPVLWAWIRAPATHFLDPYHTDIFYSSCGLKRHDATLPFPLLCNCTVLPAALSTGPYLDILGSKCNFKSDISQNILHTYPSMCRLYK